MQPQTTSYDSVLYPSYTHPQTHPANLAAIGSLLGLDPAAVSKCRVLELGCGNGSNLAPMAWGFPQSEFVGLDLAARPIARAQEMARAIGLRNLRLMQADLAAIGSNASWGRFDYIIAHGLYSWIPPHVQEKLLALCRTLLSPQGIAFVSYNALPGGHLRNMLREMMLFHVRGFDSAEERITQAQALVQFLAGATEGSDEYRAWLKGELECIRAHDDGHLYHDELAERNEPLYFTQFMERAVAHGLQYLAGADFFVMFPNSFSDVTRQTLDRLAANRLLREQYLDFLKCRRFRQTLLCHREAKLSPQPNAASISRFFVSSLAECDVTPADLNPGVVMSYQTPRRGKCATDFALGKAALSILGPIWPMPLAFEELHLEAAERLKHQGIKGSETQSREKLADFLLSLYSAGVVEFRTEVPVVARKASEKPMASPVARWQAHQGDFVSTLFHIAVKVEDAIGQSLLCWLDGTLDRTALVEKTWRLLESKNALNLQDGNTAAARGEIASKLEQNLEKLARLGLLVG